MIFGRSTAAAHHSPREWVKYGSQFYVLWDFDNQWDFLSVHFSGNNEVKISNLSFGELLPRPCASGITVHQPRANSLIAPRGAASSSKAAVGAELRASGFDVRCVYGGISRSSPFLFGLLWVRKGGGRSSTARIWTLGNSPSSLSHPQPRQSISSPCSCPEQAV